MGNKLEYVNCLSCGKDDAKIYFKQNEWRVLKCSNCGFLYTNPRPTSEELPKYYTSDYFESDRFAGFHSVNYDNRLKDILRFKKDTCSILEIGSANGHFLNYMKERGCEVSGVEYSSDAAKSTKEVFHIDVFNGDFLDYDAEAKFDIICMYQVLEHVPEPVKTIKKAYSLLKENGLFIVEVPNINGYDMKIDESRKVWSYDLPIHLSHFTPSLLSKIVNDIGFSVKHIDRYYPQFVLDYYAKKAKHGKVRVKGEKRKSDSSKNLTSVPKESLKVRLVNFILSKISYFYPGWRFTIIAQK